MEQTTLRAIAVLFVALFFMAVLCVGLFFVLAGDDIIDFVRIAPARLNVFLNKDELDQPLGTDTSPIRFVVELGDSPTRIANNLVAWMN